MHSTRVRHLVIADSATWQGCSGVCENLMLDPCTTRINYNIMTLPESDPGTLTQTSIEKLTVVITS